MAASASASPSMSPSVSPSVSPSRSPSASPSEAAYNIIAPSSNILLKGVKMVKWTGLNQEGDTGAPVACPEYAVRSVHVVGTFAGATVTLQGSNKVSVGADGGLTPPAYSEYSTLYDSGGSGLTVTSAGVKTIRESTFWVRPVVTGVGSTTDLEVYLLLVK